VRRKGSISEVNEARIGMDEQGSEEKTTGRKKAQDAQKEMRFSLRVLRIFAAKKRFA
jgi:hypothetical protein